MRTTLLSTTAALASFLVSTAAFAGTPGGTVPEPGTWALVGLAAAIGWAVTRSKRK
ncbi:MAG: PEP-CTERM sorting domain-containing protein [Rubrivivax sp.]|nr:PEP-CTERM sorting domain-containing protein [Rubrivivax sp.]